MKWLNRLSHIGLGMMIALTFPLAAHRKHETPRCESGNRLTSRSAPAAVDRFIRCLSRLYHLDPQHSVDVAHCESGSNPRAYNPPYAGVYQHDENEWAKRARLFGFAGHSVWDPQANVGVTLRSVRWSGWGPWECA